MNATWNYAQGSYQLDEQNSVSYTRRDLVFTLIFLLFGYLCANALPFRRYPLALFLLSLSLLALTACYYGKAFFSKAFFSKGARSLVILTAYFLHTAVYLTSANAMLRFVTVWLQLILLAAFWYDRARLRENPLHDAKALLCLKEALYGYLVRYGALFGALKENLGKGERARKGWRTVGLSLIGLIVAVLPTLVIGLLLSYDNAFTSLLDSIFDFSFDNIFETVYELIFGILTAAALFSLIRFAKDGFVRIEKGDESGSHSEYKRFSVPRPILYAAVTPILVLYALFFFSQKDYYLSAFTNTLPEGFTYAAYAREGFFQLCIVACLNAVILLTFTYLIKKKDTSREILCRIYSAVLSLFTLILIATALSKMVLYIGSYGLTHKRVYASWLILLLGVLFLLFLIKQLARKLPVMKCSAVIFLSFFLLIALPNTDAIIANYNVDRYLDQSLDRVDVNELSSLGISSVEARLRLEAYWLSQLDPLGHSTLTEEEKKTLDSLSKSLDLTKEELDTSFFAFSIPNERAKRLLEERDGESYDPLS